MSQLSRILLGELVCALCSLLWNIPSVVIPGTSKVRNSSATRPSFNFLQSLRHWCDRKREEATFQHQIKSVVWEHLGLHLQNLIPREGIRQLPYVRRGKKVKGVETVQGHVGACKFLAQDIGSRLLGWSERKIDHLTSMLDYHEVDEIGHGDVSLFNMEQKRSPNWKPFEREEWYIRRWNNYDQNGGRVRVVEWVRIYLPNNPEKQKWVRELNEEFARGKTEVARLANQVDAFQAVMETAARLFWMRKVYARPVKSVQVQDAQWNFNNYYAQAVKIMEDPVMVAALEILAKECLGNHTQRYSKVA